MAETRAPLRRIPWPARFVALAAIWGLSFVFIKLAVGSFEPFQVVALRLAFGAATLVVIVAITGEHLPRGRRTWLHLAFGTIFMNVAPFALFAYGEQRVSSLLAGIWNATTPLMTLPVVLLLLPNERATLSRVVGLVIGFLGVIVVLGAWSGLGEHDVTGDLMCLAAAACYGVGFPYARRFLIPTGNSPLSLAAGQTLVGTVEASLLAVVLTAPPQSVTVDATLALVALGALGTGVAYILSWSILRDAGATAASMVTYALPVVSVAAGVVLLGESLSWNEPVGALIIVVGALLTQGALLQVGQGVGRRLRARTITP